MELTPYSVFREKLSITGEMIVDSSATTAAPEASAWKFSRAWK
jgi:hypothetical protein